MFNDDYSRSRYPDTLAPVHPNISRASSISSMSSYSPSSTVPASIVESEPVPETTYSSRSASFVRLNNSDEHLSSNNTRHRRQSREENKGYHLTNDVDRVPIGNQVTEGHQNYVLMYNMLNGIRVAVSRVSAKQDRELTEEDYWAAHKLEFDETGDELTPSALYDFKFKDYAPWVFRHLRAQFGINPGDYLMSLTSKYILSEMGSPGKSGSFFYYSRDYRYIIKTITHSEHKCLRRILTEYFKHVTENPNTLLCRYYGLHRVRLPRDRKIYFVIMGNVFPPHNDIHEIYDLKGSTIGRMLHENEITEPMNAVMKDLNWEINNKKLQMGPEKRKLFTSQLVRDVKLLARMNLMDYSLLIGIHYLSRGNKENIRASTLQFFEPDTKTAVRRASMMKRRESRAEVYRNAIAQTKFDPLNGSELPDEPLEGRGAFYSDDGGFRSTDENDHPTTMLYYLGVIDILTAYNTKKKSEHFFKSITQDKHAISSVNSAEYGDRFMGFMANAIEHNQDIPHEYQLTSDFTY